MLQNFLKDCKITLVSPSAVAGTTGIDSTILDMSGYDGVVFIANTGDVTATCVLTLTAKCNASSTTAASSTVTGAVATFTAGATDADDKLLVVDVYMPQMRYVYANLTRTTANAVIGSIVAIQYRAATRPVTQATNVIASALAVEKP